MAYIKFSVDQDFITHFKKWFNKQDYPKLRVNLYQDMTSWFDQEGYWPEETSEDDQPYYLADKCFTRKGFVYFDNRLIVPEESSEEVINSNINTRGVAGDTSNSLAYVAWPFNVAWDEICWLMYPLNPIESSEGLIDSPYIYLYFFGNENNQSTSFDYLADIKIKIEFPHDDFDEEFFKATDDYYKDYHHNLEYKVLLDNYFITIQDGENSTRTATDLGQEIVLPIFDKMVWNGYNDYFDAIEPRYQRYFILIDNMAFNYRRHSTGGLFTRSNDKLEFRHGVNQDDLMFNYQISDESNLPVFLGPWESDTVYLTPVKIDGAVWAGPLLCKVDENNYDDSKCIWYVKNGNNTIDFSNYYYLKTGHYRISVIGVNYNSISLPDYLISSYEPELNGK